MQPMGVWFSCFKSSTPHRAESVAQQISGVGLIADATTRAACSICSSPGSVIGNLLRFEVESHQQCQWIAVIQEVTNVRVSSALGQRLQLTESANDFLRLPVALKPFW